MLLIDGHLDLAMNALEWNRDLTRPLAEMREREAGKTDKVDRGRGVCTLPEMRRGGIGLCIATQIARYVAPGNPLPGWHSPEIAWAMTQGQLAWYQAMEDRGEMVQIASRAALDRHVTLWQEAPAAGQEDRRPVGYILSLEGADSIVELSYLERAYASGLRAIGPAHYGPGRYSPGTGASGGLTPAGRDLVREMQRLGITLDVTHLTDEAFWEALEIYDGPVWASHNNCRELVPHQRQFSDEQLKELIRRDAVIGGAFDAWMMVPGWVRGKTTPADTGVKIETIVDHFDHICQLAGSVRHCAIGSDLDGGYGTEQTAGDLDSIADLARLAEILTRRGYSADDVAAIMHANWLRKFREALPA
ncbi:MAG: dipeptidase [Pirellulaceae bacterium]|jgi:membrane dipeptidase|nr:dipeptidase [Pirellulaceae bacterium]